MERYLKYAGRLTLLSGLLLSSQTYAAQENCAVDEQPAAQVIPTWPTTIDDNDGKIKLLFSDKNADYSKIKFSLDGGQTYSQKIKTAKGQYVFEGLFSGSYDIHATWGDGSCPTQLRTVELDSVIDCPMVGGCKTPDVHAQAGQNNITFTFADSPNPSHSKIIIKLAGPVKDKFKVKDKKGIYVYDNLPAGEYKITASWPNKLGQHTVGKVTVTAPVITKEIPLVDYPAPALKTTINDLEPAKYGFAIDIKDRQLTWRPGADENNSDGLISQFSPWVGHQQAREAKDPNLQLWCSNNQVEFHKADMPGTLAGPYTTQIPTECSDKFYYFLRYRLQGEVNNNPEDNWVYTALFVYDENNSEDRIDPRNRPTKTYETTNWQRFGHFNAYDRIQHFIANDAFPYNISQTSGLERYKTTFTDNANSQTVSSDTNGTVIRTEVLEWGAGNCSAPQYVVNNFDSNFDNLFDYGQIISWEQAFSSTDNQFPDGTSIGSQVYSTQQNVTLGQGFSTTTGDPRLNSAGHAGVKIRHSHGCNPLEKEELDAQFTIQLTTVKSPEKVDKFIKGHDLFHGMPGVTNGRPGDAGFAGSNAILDIDGNTIKPAGEGSCGDCHFRDGRSYFVVQTAKGPRLAPPTYGTGLLEWIIDAEAGLTWDGSVSSVREQAEIALEADLGLTIADIGSEQFEQLVTYNETLHVPVREYSSYADEDVVMGEKLFHQVECATCHQVTQKTRSDAPVGLRDIVIRPYTDMKLHSLNANDADDKFRTAPLWGLGENIKLLERNGKQTLFMHDGSATTLQAAIQAHNQEGLASKQAFSELSSEQQNYIIKFIKTL